MPPKGTQITPAFFEPSLDEYLTLVGSCVKNAAGIWVPVSATNPMPTTAQDGSIVAIGAKGDAAVTDPTLAASEIALLKGLIKQLQTGPNLVQLSGSIPAGTNNIGDVDLASAIPAGSAIIGKVGIDQTTPGTTNKVVAELSGSIPAGANEIGKVQLSGSKMELYGATVATRPAATAVAIGTTFTIIDSTGNFDSWISDGMNWREV